MAFCRRFEMEVRDMAADRDGTAVARAGPWWHLFRRSGDIVVYCVDLTPCVLRDERARGWLDSRETAQRSRYIYPRPGRDFTLCRAALRALLCGRLGCRNDQLSFDTSRYGKPHALVSGVRAPVGFNVSHDGRHGLIALTPEGSVGVDVEEYDARRDLEGIAKQVFTPCEQAELAGLDGANKVRLFFDLWTMKEALIKALGTGFYLSPSRFEIPPALRRGGRGGVFRFPQDPAVAWRLEKLGNARFSGAVAWET